MGGAHSGAIALGSGRVKRQKRQRDSGHGIFDEPCVLSSHLGGMRLYEQWRGGLSPFDSWVSNENCHGFGRGLCTISPAITGGRRGARWQRKRCFTVQSVETKPCGGRGGVPPAELGIPSWNSLTQVETTDELRFLTGMGELDRVLGGGAVRGSLVLVGGAPGIGKSTLMLQICDNLCQSFSVLYVSGEESELISGFHLS